MKRTIFSKTILRSKNFRSIQIAHQNNYVRNSSMMSNAAKTF